MEWERFGKNQSEARVLYSESRRCTHFSAAAAALLAAEVRRAAVKEPFEVLAVGPVGIVDFFAAVEVVEPFEGAAAMHSARAPRSTHQSQ